MSVLPARADKPRFVAAMFGRIARRYDLMNTLMTAGQDARWRALVARSVAGSATVLDVGTGTGKLAATIARRPDGPTVIGVDFSEPMLRAGAAQHAQPLAVADALSLPFADGSFDATTNGFVVRNLADVRAGLAEQQRILRAGGRLVVLETVPSVPGALGPFIRAYWRWIVPLLGRFVGGDATAYTYLPQSTAAFLEPERLAAELRDLDFRDVRVRLLSFGTVAIVEARK